MRPHARRQGEADGIGQHADGGVQAFSPQLIGPRDDGSGEPAAAMALQVGRVEGRPTSPQAGQCLGVTAHATMVRPARQRRAIRRCCRCATGCRHGPSCRTRHETCAGCAIGESGHCRGLPFNRQQSALRLDHEIHFLSDGGAPVPQLHPPELRVAPGQQVVQHHVFEMGALRFRSSQMRRDAGVRPVEVRR